MQSSNNNDMYFERRMTTLEMEYKNINDKLDKLIVTQENFVNKLDLKVESTRLETTITLEVTKLDNKTETMSNKIIWQLGSLMIGCITILGFYLQYFGHR